ncbi:hypothetical protein [Mycolicibacterium fortuitum]|jgi:hypothetical protein
MWAQVDHADLGLIPDTDHTEDLRPTKNDDPGAATPRPSEPTLTRK